MRNHAFIDSQNLNLSIRNLGWKLDFRKFRRYLKEKYKVEKANLFIGLVAGNEDLYKALQDMDYELIFKPTLKYQNKKTKGNCDAELVLKTVSDFYEEKFDKAILVSGDGDFYCLAKFLIEKEKLGKILIPNQNSYSGLLKHFDTRYLSFVSDFSKKLKQ
jgi:uncharacterized LabA/DUF88 family protein